jgi:Tol biopolymer transport system component
MMALQFRRERGANSEDVELNVDTPKTVRIEKHGDTFTMYLSMKGEPLHQAGASVTLHLQEPFYVGLGAVSHNVNWTDKVEFSQVKLEPPAASAAQSAELSRFSTLQTISINDQFRRAMVVRTVPGYIQSPNWAPGGKAIYVHEDGHIVRIPYLEPPAGGEPQTVDTGKLVGCSGNYGVSPDGKWLAVSCSQVKGGQHDVYVLSASGGATPRKVTSGTVSSYFHAWAPDSAGIAFTRGSAGKADIFKIGIDGGTEARLTQDTLNDGPDFSLDGKYVYFDSTRSGSTQIWRMQPDGSNPEQLTDDANNNSSPHVSPDGRTIAFISQPPDFRTGDRVGDTRLKVMSSSDGLIRDIASFQGNRGSFSMYGWGDESHLAFVSYQELPR